MDDSDPRETERAGRYAVLHLHDEATVLYDRDNPAAWIQTDATAALADLQ